MARSLLQTIHDLLSEVAAPGVVVIVLSVAPVLVDPTSTVAPVPVIATVPLVDIDMVAASAVVPPSVPPAVPALVPLTVVVAVLALLTSDVGEKDNVGE